jgi:Fis family transcriptional regulator
MSTPARTEADEAQASSLSHCVERALEKYFADLDGHTPGDLHEMVLQQVERPLLARVLEYTGGNQSRAAAVLGINRATLRKKLRHYGISHD